MGKLSGFKYRDVVKRPKKLGFEFARQAAGSNEIWFNPKQKDISQSLITLQTCLKEH